MAKPGDYLANTHFTDRFTCPECLNDNYGHANDVTRCEFCGASLECRVEMIPEAICQIADSGNEADDG